MAQTQGDLPRSIFGLFLGGLAATFVGGASSFIFDASVFGGAIAIGGTALVLTSGVRILLAIQRRRTAGPLAD